MKHSLQLKLSQHLTLTPQLQQSIRLLQLSTIELNQELERYLAENPLLERADPEAEADAPLAPPPPAGAAEAPAAPEAREESPSFADEATGFVDDAPSAGSRSRDDEDRDDFTQYAAAEPTLQEHLLQQLSLTGLTVRDKRIAALVVAHLNEDGYLLYTLEELHEACAQALPDVEVEELSIALRHVHNLEPTGVGARDVPECLELQLRALPASTPHRENALALV